MALFATLAKLAEEMANTASRLKKRAALAEALRATHDAAPDANDAGLFALYLSGAPFAECDPRKLNAGGALLSKAVLAVTGATEAALTAAYRRHGDLGAAAFDLLTERAAKGREAADPSAATTRLTLADVADAFAAMAAARTTAARAALVDGLLRRATPLEAKYLLKLMLADMRMGVNQSLVEEAIAQAASTDDGTLAEARMTLFHPLGFMLASPVESPEDAVQRFSPKEERTTENERRIEAFLEDKYDGMRAQVHCGDPAQPGRVAIYSRNREDITESFPELAEAFAKVDPAQTGALILDGEILGWDYGAGDESGDTAHALPFAVLGQRIGRKRVENEWRAK